MLISLCFISCSVKEPQKTLSATILMKTPQMKFYDKGFINIYPTFTQVQIFSAGSAVLDMKIYKDRICSSTFECMGLRAFNKKYLHFSYDDSFLKNLFDRKEKIIVHKDRKNQILIKIYKD